MGQQGHLGFCEGGSNRFFTHLDSTAAVVAVIVGVVVVVVTAVAGGVVGGEDTTSDVEAVAVPYMYGVVGLSGH